MMSTYSIESEALPITIDFEVKKLLVFTVRGKFTRTSGEVYFEENNLLTKCQFGFLKEISTERAATVFLDKVRFDIERGVISSFIS